MNPVSVGGIKRLLNKVAGEVTEAASKAARRDGENFEADGSIRINGNFAFDKDGVLGIVANVFKDGAGDTGAKSDAEWNSLGDGNLSISFTISVSRHGS